MEEWIGKVDEEGRLILPPELASCYALRPGTQIRIDEGHNGLRLRRPITQLAKVYIEPTNQCNLACRTCIRNVWDEPVGQMESATFGRIMEGLRAFSPPPAVFFGCFGGPLAHPDIVEMIADVKALGAQVEVITNGTLLARDMSRQLIEAGLDVLWVSLDGATPASYADVRLGAALPEVLTNLAGFRDARMALNIFTTRIGIVFVAMKRNFADFPAVMRLGHRVGATRFFVSNVLPYTAELCEETLFSRALTFSKPPSVFRLDLPKINISEVTRDALYIAMRSGHSIALAGGTVDQANDRCPFIERGATAISWDGNVSPCLPLMHNHVSYLDEWERTCRRYVIGNVSERGLDELWYMPDYVDFRERVQEFDFPFCTICGGCQLAETNEEDCFGNTFPTCGGCLWAQGVIQCP